MSFLKQDGVQMASAKGKIIALESFACSVSVNTIEGTFRILPICVIISLTPIRILGLYCPTNLKNL